MPAAALALARKIVRAALWARRSLHKSSPRACVTPARASILAENMRHPITAPWMGAEPQDDRERAPRANAIKPAGREGGTLTYYPFSLAPMRDESE